MANVRFTLHHKQRDGRYSILMSFRCKAGGVFKQLTGEYSLAKHWSKKTHRLIPSAPNAFVINARFDELEQKLLDALRRMRSHGISITSDNVRKELSGASMEFWEYVDQFLINPPPTVSEGTLKIYQRLFNNLRPLYPALQFSQVSQDVVDAYIKKRRGQEMNDSTIRTELLKLPALLNHAKASRIIRLVPELEISINGIDPDEIALSEDEIRTIYGLLNTELKSKTDLHFWLRIFVLGTQLGVRVSDLTIEKENIFESKGRKFANLKTDKVTDAVIVPLSDLALEILEHFGGRVPEFSDVKLNIQVKHICKYAGLDQPHIWREKINGKIKETVYRKWQLVSSHTMRRSFATNLYKAGAPILMIMKITGHKTESSFLKYIRISKQEAATELAKYLSAHTPKPTDR